MCPPPATPGCTTITQWGTDGGMSGTTTAAGMATTKDVYMVDMGSMARWSQTRGMEVVITTRTVLLL